MEKLNIEAVKNRIVRTVSTEEALKDVVPMEYHSNIIDGKEKVVITSGKSVQDNKNKFEIKMEYV